MLVVFSVDSCNSVLYYSFACITLQLNADGQNEFVKSYLQQREQLMSQQMEDRKRYEGDDDLTLCAFNIAINTACKQ